jgi:hypothetical protein
VEDNDGQEMFSPHAAELTEDSLKELRATWELEDEEDQNAGVQKLHLSTSPLKKGLQMADDFVVIYFRTTIINSARNLSTRWRPSRRHANIYVYNNMQEKTKQSSVPPQSLLSVSPPRTTSFECADNYYRRKTTLFQKTKANIFVCTKH